MSTLLVWQRVSAERESVNSLLSRIAKDDIAGRIGLEAKLKELDEELDRMADEPNTTAEVALVFHGAPVTGSSAIQASFGSRALEAFQKSVSTSYALMSGDQVGERGPVKAKDLAALHITGLAHGSFGFILEEIDPKGKQLVDTTLKRAADNVLTILHNVSSDDEGVAEETINEISERLFVNIKDFVGLLHDSDAGLNALSSNRQIDLEGSSLERAYERIAEARLEDETLTLRGVLQGLLPGARRFEFQTGGELIRGTVARDISEEYLRTLGTSPMTGHAITCRFKKRTLVDRLSNVKHYYTLIEALPDDGPGSHPLLPRSS